MHIAVVKVCVNEDKITELKIEHSIVSEIKYGIVFFEENNDFFILDKINSFDIYSRGYFLIVTFESNEENIKKIVEKLFERFLLEK